jgi:hypothetical protein
VFSNPWYLDQVAQTVVTKTDVVNMQTKTLPNTKCLKDPKHNSSKKIDRRFFAIQDPKKTVPKRKVVKRSKTYQKMQICLFILMAQMREKREGT